MGLRKFAIMSKNRGHEQRGELLDEVRSRQERRVSLVIPRGGILPPQGLGPWRQLPCAPVRPAPGRRCAISCGHRTRLGCVPSLREWLDGVSDALCISPPRLRDYRPYATAAIRTRLRLPGTTGLRVALPGRQRMSLVSVLFEPGTFCPLCKSKFRPSLWGLAARRGCPALQDWTALFAGSGAGPRTSFSSASTSFSRSLGDCMGLAPAFLNSVA